jgi:bifunctional non-homologous end joining protein LigD
MRTAKRATIAPKKPAPAPRKRAKVALPAFVDPQLCATFDKAPSGRQWVHEPKLDGYRIAGRIDAGKVKLLTRSGLDWANRYPSIVAAMETLEVGTAYLDGELCGVGSDGMPSFALTQQASDGAKNIPLVYYGFDLLHLNGKDIGRLPLLERKALLQPIIEGVEGFQYVSHVEADGEAFREQACLMGLEGIVSKQIDKPYAPDNEGIWVKAKCRKRQEFVIIGWTNSDNGIGFGALLLGYYDDAGQLAYAGRCGSGLSGQQIRDLLRKMRALELPKMPLRSFPKEGGRWGKKLRPADAHWVKPKLVAEINYATWEDGTVLRQTSFEALREDKPATQVRRV